MFINKVGSEKFKETREEDRGAYKYESVVLNMSKSLVRVGDPQLRTKDCDVNLFFSLVCEALIEKVLFQLLHVVCVFLVVIHWFKVRVSYSMNKQIVL